MAAFRFYLLSAVICSVLIVGQAALRPTDKPRLIPVSAVETTPETTTATETTTAPPDRTTSTTTPTTTSTTTTTTTTQAPPTPPPSPPTPPPTPAPTPAPPTPAPGPPEQGLWPFVDEKNVTCVVVQFAAQLNVTYPISVKNVSSLAYILVNIPANATVAGGSCGNDTQSLLIGWPATVDKDNTLMIQFRKNETTKSYELSWFNITLVPSIFPNNSLIQMGSIDLYHGVEWQTPLSTSYRCAAPTSLTLSTVEADNIVAVLTLSRLQEEAFRTAAGNGFSAARDCAGGDIPDAVPIAVGCALGGMVVVVLVAYLVARRRSAARGYLSM